jgi:hypothetical protein
VTLPQEVFDHLGVKPGAKLKITKLPNRECLLQALRPVDAQAGAIILGRHVPGADPVSK